MGIASHVYRSEVESLSQSQGLSLGNTLTTWVLVNPPYSFLITRAVEMASNMEDSRFRRMLTKVVWELKPEEVKALSFTYTSFHFEKGTDMICALINQHIIKDCREDLNYLMEKS